MKGVKNIKIFDTKIFKKAKVKLVGFALAASVMISGCAIFNGNHKADTNANNNTYNIESESDYIIDDSMVEELMNSTSTTQRPSASKEEDNKPVDYGNLDTDFLNISINVNNSDVDSFKKKVDSIKVDYKYSDVFRTDLALEKYYSLNIGDKVEGSKFKIDANDLYNKVKSNNKTYHDQQMFEKFKYLDDKDLKTCTNVIADNLNDKINRGLIYNYNDLKDTLDNLKIFEYASNGTALVNEVDGILSISSGSIEKLQKNNPDINVLEMIVRHESNHLIQAKIGKNLENQPFKANYGTSYEFNDLKVNSLFNVWLYEASAEKEVLNDYNDGRKPMVYDGYIANLESLDLGVVLDKNNTATVVEDLSYQHNIDKLFDTFNATTKDDKVEILNMLYSYELASMGLNKLEGFSNAYNEKYNGALSVNEFNDGTANLKGSIATTLAKTFYKNLMTAIGENKVTIADTYNLISLFEDELSRITWYESKYQYVSDFLRQYSEIQSEFFNVISKNNNIDVNMLIENYDQYHNNTRIKYTNVSWLDESKNAYLKHIHDTRINDRKPSIIKYNEKVNSGSKSY